jgi:MarR family transcriptional regulator, 2-MHQ and catechol-resistance regulon repressor
MTTPGAKPAFLSTLRELVRCNQAFERYSALHTRELGLPPAQFDVIATLGNTKGMSCKELGQRTLITKGTLTGVLDRLEARGLVVRREDETDARRIFVALTAEGVNVFESSFVRHLAYCERAFGQLSSTQLTRMQSDLSHLRAAFDKPMQ